MVQRSYQLLETKDLFLLPLYQLHGVELQFQNKSSRSCVPQSSNYNLNQVLLQIVKIESINRFQNNHIQKEWKVYDKKYVISFLVL